MGRRSGAYWLGAGVVEHAGSNVNGLALDLVGPTSVVAESLAHSADITARHVDGLSIVEGLNSDEELAVLFDNIGELEEEDSALVGRHLPPGTLKGITSSLDGDVDVLLGGFADGSDHLLRGGVDRLEFLLLNTLNPLIVDESGRRCGQSNATCNELTKYGRSLGWKLTGRLAAGSCH